MSGAAMARSAPAGDFRRGIERSPRVPVGPPVPDLRRPEGVPANSPVPHIAAEYHTALTQTQSDIIDFLRQLAIEGVHGSHKTENGGWMINSAPGYGRIGATIGKSAKTVQRNVKLLQHETPDGPGKMCIRVMEAILAGGRRVATSYFILPFADTLKARKADERIAKTDGDKPVVYGPGRNWMTPEELARWARWIPNEIAGAPESAGRRAGFAGN